MHQRTKSIVRIFFLLTLVVMVFAVLAIIIGLTPQPVVVTAQEPQDRGDWPVIPFNQEKLAEYGLSIDAIQASSDPFDLAVTKTANAVSVTSGDPVTFTISIKNNGPNSAPYVFFRDDYPSQMQNVKYLFSTAAVSNGLSNPTWWVFTDAIPVDQTVVATVTGRLVSGSTVTVKNEATAIAAGELTPSNNSDDVNVSIVNGSPGGQNTVFLPIVYKSSLVYYDDFSDDDSGWLEYSSGGCETDYQEDDEEYRIEVDSDESCFGPAPREAEYNYGKFQVSARVSSGEDSYAYGIYINGKGGSDYYLFRIRPNDNCGWKLFKRKDDNNSTVAEGGCHSAINRGKAKNVLRIEHFQDGTLRVYVNGTPLFSGDQDWFPGKGTGVYVEADDNKGVTVRFDDFTVWRP